jgi:arylsulfatase A-like enzyme
LGRATGPVLIAGLLLLLGGALVMWKVRSIPPRDRPNVLLIIVDTLRADYLHCYGFPEATSPNIDTLAARSVLFERAVAAAGYTGPAHVAIMTSTYPRQSSMGYANGAIKLTRERTLAEYFRHAGYDTAAFISNFVLRRSSGLGRGFDVYDDELTTPERNRREVFERRAEATTQRALAWLGTRRDRPFFLWVHYQDPHGPYTPPAPYDAMFHLAAAPGEAPLPVASDIRGYGGIPSYQVLDGVRRPSEYESQYAGEIRYADHWIGRLIAAVEGVSPKRPTVILFTADHGESFGESNYFFAHGHSTKPDLSHVPLILHAPGLRTERRHGLVSQVDILPTLLDLAGLPPPQPAAGIALGPYLRRRVALPVRTLYTDIGYAVSAYAGDHFVRASVPEKTLGLAVDYQGGKANREQRLLPLAALTRRQTFQWDGGAWEPAAMDEPLDGRIERYFGPAAPAREAVHLDAADRERLRALGYETSPPTQPPSR